MNQKPTSIKTPLTLTFCVIGLVVTATAFLAHERSRANDLRAAEDAGALLFAKVASRRFSGTAAETLHDDCRRLLDDPAILAVSLCDSSGRELARTGIGDELADRLMETTARKDYFAVERLNPPRVAGLPDGHVHLVVTPVVGGLQPMRMGLLLRLDPMRAPGHLGSYHAPVAMVMVLAGIATWSTLRRYVWKPAEILLSLANDEEMDDPRRAVPAKCPGEWWGVAAALNRLEHDISEWRRRAHINERRVGTEVAKETQLIIRDLKRVQTEAWRDALTGIHNRRFLDEKMHEIFAAQESSKKDLSVVMLDLDNFKILNDTKGHAAGDEILRFLGDLLRQCLRNNDVAVRYGGDEFALLLPGVPAENAQATADRILAMFSQRAKMMFDVEPAPSLSAGIASLVKNGPTDENELLRFADEILLAAKKSGKAKAMISVSRGEHPASCSSSTPYAPVV